MRCFWSAEKVKTYKKLPYLEGDDVVEMPGKELAVIKYGKQRFDIFGSFLSKFCSNPYTSKEFAIVAILVVAFTIIEAFALFAAAISGSTSQERQDTYLMYSDTASQLIVWGIILLAIWPVIRLIKNKAYIGIAILIVVILANFFLSPIWFRLTGDGLGVGWINMPLGHVVPPILSLLLLGTLVFWIGTAGSFKQQQSEDEVLTRLQRDATIAKLNLDNYSEVKPAKKAERECEEKYDAAKKAVEPLLEIMNDFRKADKTVPDAEKAKEAVVVLRDPKAAEVEKLKKQLSYSGDRGDMIEANNVLVKETQDAKALWDAEPGSVTLKRQYDNLVAKGPWLDKLNHLFVELEDLDHRVEAAEANVQAKKKALEARPEITNYTKATEDEKSAHDALARASAEVERVKKIKADLTSISSAAEGAIKGYTDKRDQSRVALDQAEASRKFDGGAWYGIVIVLSGGVMVFISSWEGFAILSSVLPTK